MKEIQSMDIKVSEKGINIPKEYLEGFDQVTMIRKNNHLIIKPKSLTRKLAGRIKSPIDVDDVINSYEVLKPEER